MPTVKLTLDELRAKPPKLSPEERARLDALTEEDIERAAASDPDNPLWTEEELAHGAAGRTIRLAREGLQLTQAQFAERFRINLARLRDLEQGRHMPDSAFMAYIHVIARAPDVVDRALAHRHIDAV